VRGACWMLCECAGLRLYSVARCWQSRELAFWMSFLGQGTRTGKQAAGEGARDLEPGREGRNQTGGQAATHTHRCSSALEGEASSRNGAHGAHQPTAGRGWGSGNSANVQ
jgi:hypothetical protein